MATRQLIARMSRLVRLALGLCFAGVLACGLLMLLRRDSALAAVLEQAGSPTVRYVSPSGTDTGACTSPTMPCATPQYAVDQAAPGDEIRLAGGLYSDVRVRNAMTQVVYLNKDVALRGGWDNSYARWQPDQYPSILDAGGQGRGVVIVGTSNALVTGLRITGGRVADYGGGLYVTGGFATISNCTIVANQAAYGGGVYLERSAAALVANQVLSNTVVWRGGGLFLFASPARLEANRIAGNQASADGGGLYLRQSPATVLSDVIEHNQAPQGDGGGIYLESSQAGITSTRITMNRSHSGAGLYLNGSSAALDANLIADNTSQYDGAGIYLANSPATVNDNVIRGNRAAGTNRRGGGLYAAGGRQEFARNQVQDNTAPYGGGMYLERGVYTLRQNHIQSNTAATSGGGVYVLGGAEGGPAQIDANVIAYNTAGTSGGGLYLYTLVAVTLTNNTVLTNTAATYGGGLFLGRSHALLDSNSFQGNSATAGYGGGFYLDGVAGPGLARLEGNAFTSNQAGTAGGGLFLNGGDARLNATAVIANQVRGNFADGGGIYLLEGRAFFSNTVVAGNSVGPDSTTAPPAGSAILADGAGYSFAQTTFARNTGAEGSALRVERRWAARTASAVLTNTIIAGQVVGVYAGEGSNARLTGTLRGSGPWSVGSLQSGAGSVVRAADATGDPAFVAPARNDYHIDRASAAIDRGVAAGVRTDIDGQDRPNPTTGIPDLGADEWYARAGQIIYMPVIRKK